MSMHVQPWLSGLYPAWRGKGHLVRDGHGKDPLARTEAPVNFFNRLRQIESISRRHPAVGRLADFQGANDEHIWIDT
jgi:hypothetical protein